MQHTALSTQLLSTLALLTLCACVGTRGLSDPTLVIESQAGRELGVSTDYGIVFLGAAARSGEASVTAWFGDGPNLEKTVVEPVSHGLYTAETEIRLPHVRIEFTPPRTGDELMIVGRDQDGLWREFVEVLEDPRVKGLVTTIPERLRGAPDQVGAGVYVLHERGQESSKALVGLVSGIVTLRGEGGERQYLAIVGCDDLWRLVSHRRDGARRQRWIYRDDVL